jgi:hypothetical protein
MNFAVIANLACGPYEHMRMNHGSRADVRMIFDDCSTVGWIISMRDTDMLCTTKYTGSQYRARAGGLDLKSASLSRGKHN